jgi:hypothetical protein
MELMTVIVTAVATGAASGLTATAQEAIKEAYTGLKNLILRKFGKQGDTAKAIQDVESKPESNGRKETLKEELTAAGADRDQDVVDKATELLKLLERASPGASGGLVGQINAAGGRVVVIGTNYAPIDMSEKK